MYLFNRMLALMLVTLAAFTASVSAQGIVVTVDGQKVPFSGQEPVMSGGTVLVPLRGVFEKLGASVQYDGAAKRIIATKGETAVVLVLGSDTAYINGDAKKLLSPANVMNGSTMVPLRFVSEALGAQVAWNKNIKTVEIVTAATNAGNLPTLPGVEQVTGRVTGVFPQLNPPLITLMVNGQNTQVPLSRDVVVLIRLPDGKDVQSKLSDIRRGDQVTVKLGVKGEGILVESTYGEMQGIVKSIRRLQNSNYEVTLSDGTVVEMAADSPVTMAGRSVSISDVFPEDRVIIRVNPQTRIAYGMAVVTAGEDTPTPPAAVKITSFTYSPTETLKLGSTMTVKMVGTPGGKATFEIPGLKGAEAVPMTEQPAGTYTGTYKIPAGVSVKGATVLGTLKVGAASAPTIQAPGTVTIDSVPPTLSGMTPANGDIVADERPLIYATLSDTTSGTEAVTIKLDGVDVTKDSTITPAFFSYRPAKALALGEHTVVVRVADEAGNTTEQTVKFTVKSSAGSISDIVVSPAGPYSVGDTISVAVKAAAGGTASFGIGSVVTGVSLKETSQGSYTGTYKVKEGNSVEKAPLTVVFKPKSGSEVTATASDSVTINAGPPAAPTISAPVPGAVVESPIVVTGKAAPNSVINVVVGYTGQLLILPVEGTVASVEVKAGADGKWKTDPIELAKPAGVSKLQYAVIATVVDASGQESREARIDFKRK